ncbi:MAG: hypothetical protein V3S30_09895 [Thermoanaerobaculia bacterium]
MLKLPKPWLVWIGVMVIMNLVAPFLFLDTLEAKVVLATFMLGVVLQTAIFSARGFVRLLGLGHSAWIPLVIWLWTRLDLISPGSSTGYWLIGVMAVNTVSLVIDVTDVIRYINGDRTPQLEI